MDYTTVAVLCVFCTLMGYLLGRLDAWRDDKKGRW